MVVRIKGFLLLLISFHKCDTFFLPVRVWSRMKEGRISVYALQHSWNELATTLVCCTTVVVNSGEAKREGQETTREEKQKIVPAVNEVSPAPY